MEEFIQDPASLIAAIGSLIAAIAALVKAIRDATASTGASNEGPNPSSYNLGHLVRMPMFILGILLMLFSIGIFGGRAISEPMRQPLNTQLVVAAWDAYNIEDYPTALSKTQECINHFETQALREQETLSSETEPTPPVGKVTPETQTVVFSRGILNDLATCYFIRAQSFERLNRLAEAKDSYTETTKFSYARTWDPTSGFWSPAQAASDRLARFP